MAELILLPENVRFFLQLIMSGTALLLAMEIWRLFAFVHSQQAQAAVARRMMEEHVPEKVAEQEVEEEEQVKKREKRVARFALDEFILLKELLNEVNSASTTMEFLERAAQKIKDLKKEERIEKRLTSRLQPLYREAERLAQEQPRKKRYIEETLLEMDTANKALLALMGSGGKLEQVLNQPISASLSPERKKELALAILREALRADEQILAAIHRLNEAVK